jgi:dihydroneopterin aldolase/2-amino-4-hydroxy-6-hydroxymethyldihydropteridine diphosphokinase
VGELPADRIELRGLRAIGTHGVLPEERERGQPFEVDLDVVADLSAAGRSDALGDTIDYGALCDVVAAVISGPHADLLEHLAERIATRALASAGERAVQVTVTVRKLRPPVPVELASSAVTITRRRSLERRAFLALGSNLGDRWGALHRAAHELPDVVARSSVWETEPVGGPEGQGPYLNAVVELRTSRSAHQLLEEAQAAERRAARVRAERWGPRTLDVDVLWVEGERWDTAELTVPHPRMWERGFVLVPLSELAPELVEGRLSDAQRAGVRRAGSL